MAPHILAPTPTQRRQQVQHNCFICRGHLAKQAHAWAASATDESDQRSFPVVCLHRVPESGNSVAGTCGVPDYGQEAEQALTAAGASTPASGHAGFRRRSMAQVGDRPRRQPSFR
jgi:hypothetical protein